MANQNRILLAAGAIGTAAAIAFLMQKAGEEVARPGLTPASPVESSVLSGLAIEPPAPLEISGITLTSATIPDDQPRPVIVADAPHLVSVATVHPDEAPLAGPINGTCAPTMRAAPTIAGLVDLAFSSACDPDTRVTFRHADLVFTEQTDSHGRIDLTVPALAEDARFSAELATGGTAIARARVESVMFYDRAVVQGDGGTGVSLHAMEFGAGYDSAGHVSADNPRDPTVAAKGEGGFLMTLGDATLPNARIAQVYSFPTGTAKSGGNVSLELEIEVLSGTCGRGITARVFQVSGGLERPAQDVAVTLPDCDAVGDYLVLKTPLDDLKIAMN